MDEPRQIRILLADDHEIVREGLRQILEDVPGMIVVGQAGNGAEAAMAWSSSHPDVVVLDYSMPETDTPTLIARLITERPQTKLLLLTMHESVHYAVKALESGAHGYVIKSAAVRELVEAIQKVCAGDVYLSPKIAQRIIANMRKPRNDRSGLSALSPKELEVLRALASGMSLKECAAHLEVSLSTASTYRSRLMDKLGLSTTVEIIRFALENEIVD